MSATTNMCGPCCDLAERLREAAVAPPARSWFFQDRGLYVSAEWALPHAARHDTAHLTAGCAALEGTTIMAGDVRAFRTSPKMPCGDCVDLDEATLRLEAAQTVAWQAQQAFLKELERPMPD